MADTVITKLAAAITAVNDGEQEQARILTHEALELLGGDIDPVTEILKKISELRHLVNPSYGVKFDTRADNTRIYDGPNVGHAVGVARF